MIKRENVWSDIVQMSFVVFLLGVIFSLINNSDSFYYMVLIPDWMVWSVLLSIWVCFVFMEFFVQVDF